MRKYDSEYIGKKLDDTVNLVKNNWIQLQVTGGAPNDSVILSSGDKYLLTNKIPGTITTWINSNCEYTINDKINSIIYPNYDLYIVDSLNHSNSKITYQLNSVNINHKYYFKAFVDGLNSNGINHGIQLESSNGSSYASSFTTTLDAVYLSCIGEVTSTLRIALYANKSSTNANSVVHFGRLAVVDLTSTFGSGKEPNQEWCDNYIDFYSPDGQYNSSIVVSIPSDKDTSITNSFDSDGICLVNIPSFGKWATNLNDCYYIDDNILSVDRVKKFFINIDSYNVNNLVKNGSLSTSSISNWNTSPYYDSSLDNQSRKLVTNTTTSAENRFFYQNYSLVSYFQEPQVLYYQAMIKGKSSNSSYPVVSAGYYWDKDITSNLKYTDLSSTDGLTGSELNDGNWHVVSNQVTAYPDKCLGYTWNRYNTTIGQGYVSQRVNMYEHGANRPVTTRRLPFPSNSKIYVAEGYEFDQLNGDFKIDALIGLSHPSKITYNDPQSIPEAIGRYYISGKPGEDSANYILLIIEANANYTRQWELWLKVQTYISKLTTMYVKDKLIDQVHSFNARAYPFNGQQYPYWYEKQNTDRKLTNIIKFGMDSLVQDDSMWIKNVIVINLTACFGSGKEPTKSWCDRYINFDTILNN